jgi:hypothetical protein
MVVNKFPIPSSLATIDVWDCIAHQVHFTDAHNIGCAYPRGCTKGVLFENGETKYK